MWVRHMKRRDIRTIARWRKRAASGGGMGRGSFPRPEFRSPSSHRASGIVRHEGDQMRSRQLSGSSRFDRDHLIDSERRERRECHGADRGTHVPSWQRSPCRASREGQSRGCHLALSLPARPLVRGWPPIDRRSPSMAVLIIHGLPRRELSWSPSTDGVSRAICCGPRGAARSTDRAQRQILESLHRCTSRSVVQDG